MQTFKDLVADAMKRRRTTPLAAAKACGIVHSYMYEIIEGSTPPPSPKVIRKLALALKVKYETLLTAAELDKLNPSVRESVKRVYEDGIRWRLERAGRI